MAAALARRGDAGTLRSTAALPSGGAPLADFASNDYLGLARDGAIARAFHAAELAADGAGAQRSGSTGSRLLSGASECADAFERFVADFHGREAALVFGSGHAASAAVLATLPSPADAVLYDELSHNSARFGLRAGRAAAALPFSHNDARDARGQIAALRAQRPGIEGILIAVESVYSMDGDEAPLAALAEVCLEDGRASLIVDEAHATGVLGAGGRGATDDLTAEHRAVVLAQVHTFGKAVGCAGAAVAGDAGTREFLANYAQPFVFSTAPPPFMVRLARRCYDALASPAGDALRERLSRNVALFRDLAPPGGLLPSRSPVQALLVPGAGRVVAAAAAIQGHGFDVRPIRAPTVAAGAERLRVVVHAHNTRDEVAGLAAAIRAALSSS